MSSFKFRKYFVKFEFAAKSNSPLTQKPMISGLKLKENTCFSLNLLKSIKNQEI
jgi:hypothetical protein